MFYKPQFGGIWDPSVIYYNGYYYMASMYFKDAGKDRFMWVAKSADGVHWEDVGPVLENEYGVCKMFLYEADGVMVADFGSFSTVPRDGNDTIRFYRSTDMEHWESVGLTHPDGQWYHTNGRWDHMYVYKEDGTYYGYPVATPLPEYKSAWGLCKSSDGYNWETKKPPVIEWGDIPPINSLEGGGMEKIGDKYYYIGGFVGYANNYGYALYTFIADSPEGPFKPDRGAFRLCGFDRLEGRVFVQNLAAFARGKDGELLISNAVDAGGGLQIWLLPLRKAVVDEFGHLRQGYWHGNDAVKGTEIPLTDSFRVAFSRFPEGSQLPDSQYLPSVFKSEAGNGWCANTDALSSPNVFDHNMLVMSDVDIPLEDGVLLEGKMSATTYPAYDDVNHCTIMWRPSSFGFFIEEEGSFVQGMDIALEIGHPYKRYSFVEKISIEGEVFKREIIDTIGEDCANVRGIDAGVEHTFRFLYRRNMFELYVDDLHVQTFVNLGIGTGHIGFTVLNAKVDVYDLKLYKMNLR